MRRRRRRRRRGRLWCGCSVSRCCGRSAGGMRHPPRSAARSCRRSSADAARGRGRGGRRLPRAAEPSGERRWRGGLCRRPVISSISIIIISSSSSSTLLMKSMIALCLGLAQREGGDEGKLPGNFQFRPARRRQYGSAASSRALDSGAARQQCAGAAFNSRPLSVASRLRRRRLSSPSLPGQQCGEAAVRWTAARLGSRVLATPPDSRRPSVASRLCRRLSTRDACPSPLVSVAAWPAARRGSSAPAPPLDSRPPSVASRIIAVWTAVRRGGCALERRLSTRDTRPSPLISVAA